MMNHRQVELVRASYERIRRVRPLFADLFNRRLILIAPVLDRLLPQDPGRRDDAFLEMVEFVIGGLDRLDVLLPALAVQARVWRLRGVDTADYDVAGMALAWTVEQVLVGSPGAITAWRETFDLLSSVMKRAAIDPHALPPPPPPRRPVRTRPYSYPPRAPSHLDWPAPSSERTPDSSPLS
jgi:hemoglobin-like flavoprotein